MTKSKRHLKTPFKIMIIALVAVLAMSFYSLISSVTKKDNQLLNSEVKEYESLIIKYANQNGIGEYVDLLEAIMMQESGGLGNDPMQSSECEYNIQYSKKAGSIQNSEYSIEVGIKYFAKCLKQAGVTSLADESKIYLALQAYNFGTGYIQYAKEGYSYKNAIAFQEKCKQTYNVSVYGDSKYVYHVLRYYNNQDLVDDWLDKYHS